MNNLKYILGFDIGIINLALVGAYINENYTLNKIDFCELINITDIQCNGKDCSIKHDKNVAYYMKHFFRNYKHLLDKADFIVIERQPLVGITDVQEIILYEYENKSELVSPNSMHKFYNINDLEYEKRKERTVKLTQRFLKDFKSFQNNERKHDMADALCIIRFWLYNKSETYRLQKMQEEWKKKNHIFIKNMENFKYIPNDLCTTPTALVTDLCTTPPDLCTSLNSLKM